MLEVVILNILSYNYLSSFEADTGRRHPGNRMRPVLQMPKLMSVSPSTMSGLWMF